jgi:two-component system phosphate regulon sensor histidine kinase PhoR
MLQESAVPVERVPQYYTALHRETNRLQRVVEGLLDFRRFESGRGAYRMEPMDAQDTVRQVLENFATRNDSGRVRVSLCESSATIRGDRAAVAAAISNLLDNALKYSPGDSPVSIGVDTRGSMVGISVEDHGPGMTRDERRRVFRKFVRGAAAHKGNVKGTGIGLAIVEAVVRAHGGRVDLHTVPGQGSRFTLLLPRA